jgi:hypothetical protein
MNLYERDYTKLTSDEEVKYRTVLAAQTVQLGKLTLTRGSRRDYPKAARHFCTLFPNNYLDPVELGDADERAAEVREFEQLVESAGSEQEILGFIKQRRGYFIIGSLLHSYFRFGHHDAFLFPEFPLGTSFRVDYLIVGRGSGGWEFLFVELEASSRSTLQEGGLGQPFRKGQQQIEDWRAWIQAHYANLREVFDKQKTQGEPLPDEFVNLDLSRMHFAIVAGRRTDFQDRTYRTRRTERDTVLLLHYDNLIDSAKEVIGRQTY